MLQQLTFLRAAFLTVTALRVVKCNCGSDLKEV